MSPSPCKMITVAVCLVLLGNTRGFGYCQVCVCMACTLVCLLAVDSCLLTLLFTPKAGCNSRPSAWRFVGCVAARLGLTDTTQGKARWETAQAKEDRMCLQTTHRCLMPYFYARWDGQVKSQNQGSAIYLVIRWSGGQ